MPSTSEQRVVPVALSRQLQVATDMNACFCIGCGQPDEPDLHDPARCPASGGRLDTVPVSTALEVYDGSCEAEPDLDGDARALHCVILALSDTTQTREADEARIREIAATIYTEVADEPLGDLTQRRQAVQDTWHDAVRAALSAAGVA
jgi:hypothetical protein